MILGQSIGLPWWAALVLAFSFAVLGELLELQLGIAGGRIFQGAYFVGCVAAVCLVRRRNIFAPMVTPPLVLTIAVPAVLLLSGPPTGGSARNQLLTLATPLINNFPTMAVTTAVTVLIGFARIGLQRVRRTPGSTSTGQRPAQAATSVKPTAPRTPTSAQRQPRQSRVPDAGARDASRRDKGQADNLRRTNSAEVAATQARKRVRRIADDSNTGE